MAEINLDKLDTICSGFKTELLAIQNKFVSDLNYFKSDIYKYLNSSEDSKIPENLIINLNKLDFNFPENYNILSDRLSEYLNNKIKFIHPDEKIICYYNYRDITDNNLITGGIFITNYANIKSYYFIYSQENFDLTKIKYQENNHDIILSNSIILLTNKFFNIQIIRQNNKKLIEIKITKKINQINYILDFYKSQILLWLPKLDIISEFSNLYDKNKSQFDLIKTLESKLDQANINLKNIISEENRCVICFGYTNKKTALVPCGHTKFCKICLEKIAICPICNKQITLKIILFN